MEEATADSGAPRARSVGTSAEAADAAPPPVRGDDLHSQPLTDDERDRLRALRIATEPNAAAYTAILSVFVAARDRYEIELRTEQVASALAAAGHPTEALDQQLRQLVEWGNVTWTQDTTRVARLEDFRRRRAIWQLTATGAAAHAAVVAVLGASDQDGSLQRTLFRDIRENLAALGDAVDAGDAETTYLRLRDIDGSLRDLAANARDFHAAVAQLRREHDVAPDRFLAYKHLLLEYLEHFLEHLQTQRSLVSAAIADVAARGLDRVVALAAEGDDSAGLFTPVDLAATWRGRWDGLTRWFTGHAGERAGADDLAAATTNAIGDLLALLRQLSESTRRPITRASELVVLARWFRRLPDDGAAAELFDAAFGLGRPLHLSEADDDPERTAAATSWWTAPPVDVPVTLREHGRRASPGRPGKATDFSAAKARLATEHRRAQRARAEAAARLCARPIEGRTLSAPELDILLELLDRAAHQRPVGTEPGSEQPVVIESAAARLLPHPDGMAVRTVRGTLTIEGHRLDVRRATGAASRGPRDTASGADEVAS